ncbi:MAG TPA: tetratricopeptide repeat protein [Roseiflexaceae bacterium]|nr:tetratricopeptide repeat protein [Roseiflexaceae bacterium]
MVRTWHWEPLASHEHPGTPQQPHSAPTAYFEIDAPTADFVGRTQEIAEIIDCLREMGDAKRVALCGIRGMGGVGKTELAREVAYRVHDLFPDGQLLVRLRGEQSQHLTHEHVLSPVQALQAIIEKLTGDDSVSGTEAELAARYRSVLHGRRMFILADNARDAQQVEPLRPPVGCALLVTSREHIALEGMRSFVLGALTPETNPDAAVTLLRSICRSIGVHADELARLCAYLPLALRICASLLEHTPRKPAAFLRQLQAERLTHMVAGGDPNDPRFSVEASLQLSYNALTAPLQYVMQQASIFPASFDLAAAQAIIAGVESVPQALEHLYLRSIVEWQPSTERYALHDLVREFCSKRLTDADAVRLRHAQYYCTIMRTAEQRYRDGHPLEGLALFDAERVHIDTGWEWARQNAGVPEADQLLIDYDGSSFYIGDLRYDNRTERIWQAEAMRDAALRMGRRDALAQAYNNLGVPYHLLGDSPQAIAAYEHGLAIAREVGDKRQEGNLLGNLGFAFSDIGEYRKAIEYNLQRIEIARNLPERRLVLLGEAAGCANLADAYLKAGDAQRSLEYAQRGYDLTCEYGDQRGQCTALDNIAAVYEALGQEEEAIGRLEIAIQLAEDLGDRRELARTSWRLGKLLVKRDPQRAFALMRVQIDYLQSLNHPDLAQYIAEVAALR